MKQTGKRLAAVLCAVVLTVSCAVVAFAEDKNTYRVTTVSSGQGADWWHGDNANSAQYHVALRVVGNNRGRVTVTGIFQTS